MSAAHTEMGHAKPGLMAHWDSDARQREQITAWLLVAPAVLAIILLFWSVIDRLFSSVSRVWRPVGA